MNASDSSSASVAVAQRMPEHAQVLGRRVGRDGDQDDVVQQDRPAGDEADELVEGVAREHGRAAAILVQRRALDVGHRGQREEQRREQEHDRRQAERVAGDHAEREVDRARQRGVDDREQQRRADAALDDHARARRQLGARALDLRRRPARPPRRRAPGPRRRGAPARWSPPARSRAPRLLRASRYSRPPPAAMNSTPSSRRGETMLPCPLTACTISATPIAPISRESTTRARAMQPVGRHLTLSLGVAERSSPDAAAPPAPR